MKKAEFKQYLMENGYGSPRPYSEAVADERTRFCGTIEKEFSVDLDVVAFNTAAREALMTQVSAMTKTAVRRYIMALEAYYAFADADAKTERYMPMSGSHFFRLATDMPPKSCLDMLNDLEGHYETIMGWGRDLFGLDWPLIQEHLERIPVVLSPEIKKKSYPADDNYKSRKIAELAQKKHGDISPADIRDILRQKSFTDVLAGAFYPGHDQFGPHIVLYYNAIDGVTFEQKLANFVQVLAHEYMHYMQWRYCSACGVSFYENEEVSEAMADFFRVIYAIKWQKRMPSGELVTVARNRYQLWEKRAGSSWPYAQALCFYTVCGKTMGFSDHYADYEKHGCIQKLVSVFQQCTDSHQAYDKLKNM